jgi:ABC-2 type transport system ATP-binding protein
LDPNQILEIRKLIKEISTNKTVLFSTHIMQEVSALCDRVIVINKGRIVADDTLSTLLHHQTTVLLVEFEGAVDEFLLAGIEGVDKVSRLAGNSFKVQVQSGLDIRPAIFRFAADKNLSLLGLKQEESSLENIFRELTTPHEA